MTNYHYGDITSIYYCWGDTMNNIIYHGSSNIIQEPVFGAGNNKNDYGLGFYCTENAELAKEWACSDASLNGYANEYSVDLSKLNILKLTNNEYNILNWLAILLDNRTFTITNQVATQAKDYLLSNFLPDINEFDVIIGHRADDSYFAFANDFINNTISLQQLENAMYFGNLGEQIVLKSKKSFNSLEFLNSIPANAYEYYIKRKKRDYMARKDYLKKERQNISAEDLFILDILRQEMKSDHESLQRKLSI